jgi:hypothetical protein
VFYCKGEICIPIPTSTGSHDRATYQNTQYHTRHSRHFYLRSWQWYSLTTVPLYTAHIIHNDDFMSCHQTCFSSISGWSKSSTNLVAQQKYLDFKFKKLLRRLPSPAYSWPPTPSSLLRRGAYGAYHLPLRTARKCCACCARATITTAWTHLTARNQKSTYCSICQQHVRSSLPTKRRRLLESRRPLRRIRDLASSCLVFVVAPSAMVRIAKHSNGMDGFPTQMNSPTISFHVCGRNAIGLRMQTMERGLPSSLPTPTKPCFLVA